MDEEIDELWRWCWSLRKGDANYLALLEGRLQSESRPDVRRELFMLLGLECARLEDVRGQIEVFRRAVKEHPYDPLVRLSLSNAYSYFSYDLPKALDVMSEALALARQTNQFRRHVLHSKARLLRNTGAFEDLEQCLLEIMSEPASQSADVAGAACVMYAEVCIPAAIGGAIAGPLTLP